MEQQRFCVHCGVELITGASYCGACGRRLPSIHEHVTQLGAADAADRDAASCSDMAVDSGGNGLRESVLAEVANGTIGGIAIPQDHRRSSPTQTKTWVLVLGALCLLVAIASLIGVAASRMEVSQAERSSSQTEQAPSIVGRWSGRSVNGWEMTMRVYAGGRYSLEMLSDLGATGEWSQEGSRFTFYENGSMIFMATLSSDGEKLSTVDALRVRTGAWTRM